MKKLSILVALILAFSLLAVSVFAAQSAVASVSASSTTAHRGETVTVTVSVSAVDSCVAGGFMFEYDENVFDYVKDSGRALVTGYAGSGVSTINGHLAGYFMGDAQAVEGPIFEITLKVKDDAVYGNYDITGSASLKTSTETISSTVTAATITVACNHTNDYTVNDDGTHTATCTACGESVTEPHTFVNGSCACGATAAPELLNFISSTTVALNNSVALQFVIDPDLDDDGTLELIGEDNYVVINKLNRETGEWEFYSNVPQGDWETYTKGRYVAVCDLAAMQMTDQFKVVLYSSNGEQISKEWIDSGRAYGMRAVNTLINQTDDASKKLQLTMFIDFLNYCAAAQIQFEYYTDDLTNSELTDAHQAYATASVAPENLRTGVGSSQVNVEARIELSFLFPQDLVTQEMRGVITYAHFDGVEESVTIQGADFDTYTNKNDVTFWKLPAPNIATPDGNQIITCIVYDANGNEIAKAQDSVNSYMARVLASSGASDNLKALATAAVKLTTSSNNYFNK